MGEGPSGWVNIAADRGGRMLVVEGASIPGGAAEGERALALMPAPSGSPARVQRQVPAEGFRERWVRLSALVQVEGGLVGEMTLEVRREDGQTLFSSSAEPVEGGGEAWTRVVAEGPVGAEAGYLSLGFRVRVQTGRGLELHGWVDDLTLEDLGPMARLPATSGALTEASLDRLTALARLLGVVRHFHPSDEAAAVDWDLFTMGAVERVLALESQEPPVSPEVWARTLRELVRPIAPSVQVVAAGEALPPLDESRPQPAERIAWDHFGVGLSSTPTLYRSEREVVDGDEGLEGGDVILPLRPTGQRRGRPHEADLAPKVLELPGGVTVRVPLMVWRTGEGTLPRPPAGAEPALRRVPERAWLTGDDRTVRLAGVILAWNVFQHFYPYFDVVEVDWTATLRRALAEAAEDADAEDYLETLERLVADLEDGHGSVRGLERPPQERLPFEWAWAEEQLVVIELQEGLDPEAAGGLEAGDVVVEIDGVPAGRALESLEERISGATPQYRRHLALGRLVYGPAGEPRELLVEPWSRRDDQAQEHDQEHDQESGAQAGVEDEAAGLRRISVMPVAPYQAPERHEPFEEVAPGVLYFHLGTGTDELFEEVLPRLVEARGVIYDLRGYPRVSTLPLAHLIDPSEVEGPVTSAQWHVPVVRRPDREGMTFHRSGWPVGPQEPRIEAPVAVITDGRAISYAETWMGIVEHYGLAEIVGGPTAGTNGNINIFEVPGGYTLVWTGMKVLKHDGSRHHGVGILPTVPAERTRAGIAAGRDELLERAVEVVTAGAPDQ